MQTKIVRANPHNLDLGVIKEAAGILQRGGIVAFPTETVYGLAADYNNKSTISRLYDIKKRPKDKPFTIHIAQKDKIIEYIDGMDELTKRLIDEFWPGPLTIIVKSKDAKPLGFRMPANRMAIELIKQSNLTIVAPSANISGMPEPVEAFSVAKAFDGLIDMIIDAGPTEIGISSTILDVSGIRPRILREGSNIDKIKSFLNEYKKITNIIIVCTGNSCRSPMAEALLKRGLEKEGFNIKSAGTIAVDGLTASLDAIEVARRYANIDISSFLTHKLTRELTDWADLILVMDRTQKEFIKDTIPEAAGKAFLFKEYANIKDDNPDVPDPIGRPFFVYEQAYKLIEEGVKIIVKRLREE